MASSVAKTTLLIKKKYSALAKFAYSQQASIAHSLQNFLRRKRNVLNRFNSYAPPPSFKYF
jgi:hypothetical protein